MPVLFSFPTKTQSNEKIYLFIEYIRPPFYRLWYKPKGGLRMSDWLKSLKTPTPQKGYELAIKLAREG
ncbi:MAG: hypothetical protein IKF29_01815, partial [Oceanobacillus sp.]|nr:hypothetical protein [Oceanobacillus sp.]